MMGFEHPSGPHTRRHGPVGYEDYSTRVDETALGQSQWQNEDFENPEETNEEEEEEAENGHLEIQAMAGPRPRSDRRLACPARKRRRLGRAGLGRARLQSCR